MKEASRRLVFEDHGQDFLKWDIDEDGVVVACHPFQASVWCGCKVHDSKFLKAGDMVMFTSPNIKGLQVLNYPIEQIIDHEWRGKKDCKPFKKASSLRTAL